MKQETLYSILNKIEGLESIEPNEEYAKEYIVVVDGFAFKITEDLQVEDLEEVKGILPEVSAELQTNAETEEVKINIDHF